MPFTFAQPAAVLPFLRCKKYHFSALILGSLSPDFVYFLGGSARFNIGHTFWGALLVNLPLCFVFYIIYIKIWRDVLRDYLPNMININCSGSLKISFGHFSLSALIGMATHLFLDAFTHQTGYFVVQFPILRTHIGGLAWFKWFQYSGGILGLTIFGVYMLIAAKRAPFVSTISAKNKLYFWLKYLFNSMILLII